MGLVAGGVEDAHAGDLEGALVFALAALEAAQAMPENEDSDFAENRAELCGMP